MQSELRRNKGTLTQEAAWKGVRERFGKTMAKDGQDGNWLVRPVLIAFRKLTPNVMWDPASKKWQERRSEPVDGVRMM